MLRTHIVYIFAWQFLVVTLPLMQLLHPIFLQPLRPNVVQFSVQGNVPARFMSASGNFIDGPAKVPLVLCRYGVPWSAYL